MLHYSGCALVAFSMMHSPFSVSAYPAPSCFRVEGGVTVWTSRQIITLATAPPWPRSCASSTSTFAEGIFTRWPYPIPMSFVPAPVPHPTCVCLGEGRK